MRFYDIFIVHYTFCSTVQLVELNHNHFLHTGLAMLAKSEGKVTLYLTFMVLFPCKQIDSDSCFTPLEPFNVSGNSHIGYCRNSIFRTKNYIYILMTL